MATRKQTVFDEKGEIVEPEVVMTPAEHRRYGRGLRELNKRKSIRAVCPWCGEIGTLNKFSTWNADWSLAKKVECPYCKQKMTVKTTTVFDRGSAEYSTWFWNQIYFSKAYERVDFNRVKALAKELGFDRQFWEIQREIKATRPSRQ